MAVVRYIVSINRIELAASGHLQTIEVALCRISGNEIIAAVLLQADADAKAGYDLTSAVVFDLVICYCIVVRAVCYQNPIVIVICSVPCNLAEGRSPEGEPKGIPGEDIVLMSHSSDPLKRAPLLEVLTMRLA